ncbi:hypothetical protein FQN50_003772 [Emmonsiellopsis sp. PD_5]|nr:hypothetical protein FQN50_003772 [Emmonsiellopsis sp. PD_5]
MPTILEYLSEPNPKLDRSNVATGSNTSNPDWEDVDSISPWNDFTYENVMHSFGDDLNTEYPIEAFDRPNPLRHLDRCIINEDTVTAVLQKCNHIINQELLCIRRRISEFDGSPLSKNRGKRNTQIPIQISPPRNLLTPRPQSPQSPSPQNYSSRRGTTVAIGQLGGSQNRFPEHLTPPRRGRPRHDSATSAFSEMSVDSPGNLQSSPSAYTDDGNPDVNQVVEAVCIPWENSGPGRMTVNLALFYIHMLGGSDTQVRSSYPG